MRKSGQFLLCVSAMMALVLFLSPVAPVSVVDRALEQVI